MIKAEKLKTFDRKKFKPGYVSPKINGIHAIYDPEMGEFYSRTPAVIHGMNHIKQDLNFLKYPVVGELIVPNVDFETGSGMIRCYNETPEAQFLIFNSIVENMAFVDRWHMLQNFAAANQHSSWKLLQQNYIIDLGAFDYFYHDYLNHGYEGICWIDLHHVYTPGKRGWQWMKLTPILSMEVEVIDLQPGTLGKKYENTLGHFVCQTDDYKVFNVGIFKGKTDAWRDEIWQNKDSYIGQDIVIEFKAFSKYGIPVQPRFKAFRWDLK